jgi:signal transduction histidine kinase
VRDRLARTVHVGVLQSLAYIHRRGRDLGGPAAELGTMAADQELLLRALVSGVPEQELDRQVAGPVDLRERLGRFAGSQVQLVPPGEPVLLPRRVADELGAAVACALDNVRRHAGEGARAWVLVEDEGTRVRVTVRDDGRGMDEGRLAAAEAGGRMGVASSIRGRVRDLGGRTAYRSVPGRGTTVEIEVPRTGEEEA